ncbi:MAG: LamG domain-containing protein [Thermoanaerobaculia bacterium]|nr:LamG domain-containing protein [Thermoanaerobaculia bacterium]
MVYFLDGEPKLETAAIQDGFFHWKPRPMLLGNEWEAARPWHGTIEGVAVYARFLSADEARENARRYRELREKRPPVARLRVAAELLAVSKTPTLAEISPYREALAVYEYRVVKVLEGSYAETTLRVVHRVLDDGERLPAAELKPGTRAELGLEPFSAQPQLESLYRSETLPERWELELFFALEAP